MGVIVIGSHLHNIIFNEPQSRGSIYRQGTKTDTHHCFVTNAMVLPTVFMVDLVLRDVLIYVMC